ncbi:MAG: septum formation initiator family protein [Phascolarctobacterium sp.]|nr:septum formation initiator family protein [Acidaminococcaceae bacterium]MBQ7884106.1 septum formation initiator family protein [Phascolarctobacterium sp.]
MLAKKLDNAVWQEQQYTIEEVNIRQQQKKSDRHKLLRRRVMVVVAVVLATYMYSVWRSADMVHYGNEIIALQRKETQLINKNNELKIEVEQLKGPGRIIRFAERELGMSVARSNIYVKAGVAKNYNAPSVLASK